MTSPWPRTHRVRSLSTFVALIFCFSTPGVALAVTGSTASEHSVASPKQFEISSAETRADTRLEATGELTARYDHIGSTSQLRYFLKSDGSEIELRSPRGGPLSPVGARVRVAGRLAGSILELDVSDAGMQILGLSGDDSISAEATIEGALPNTTGQQQVAVLLVNFQDDPSNQPHSTQQAHDLVFGEVNDFLQENSSGLTWLAGEVFGWLTLPMDTPSDPSTDCKHSVIASASQAAAADAGIDLSGFARLIYVFPQTSCFVTASGTVGGSPSETWINGSWFRLKTVAHELGHNLGLYHSAALECGSEVLTGQCQTFVYGDVLDVMGNANAAHLNPYQKERLGWVDSGAGDIVVADSDGTYQLEVYENANSGQPKVLKIPRTPDPVSGEMRWFYLEYRQAIGHDGFLTAYPNVLNGLVLRMVTESQNAGVLLDMTPESSSTWDWGDPALEFGMSFSDPASGVLIQPLTGDGANASVAVSFSPSECVRTAPTLTVSTMTAGVAAGTAYTYSGSVVNADSVSCQSSSFNLSTDLPDSWTVSISDSNVTLGPGEQSEFSLTVASPNAQADGVHAFVVTAAHGSNGASTPAQVQYIVASGTTPNAPPVAVNDSATTAPGNAVLLDVLANDSDPDGDAIWVESVTQGENGSVQINPDGTITHTPRSRFKGQDAFSYTVTDGVQFAQAIVTVTVSKGGKGSGGGGGGNGKGKPR